MQVDQIFQYQQKVKTVEELSEVLPKRPRRKKVIMCHGVFDIVHPGHVRHLAYAKSKGAILIVSITADQHITKGNVRPHVPEKLRALNLAALEFVDYVLIDTKATPLENIKMIQPDYFAKGYEYVANGSPPKTKEEKAILDEYGGEILFTPGDFVYSSSKFIEMSPPNISDEKLMMVLQAEELTFDDLKRAVNSFSGVKVHLVGDTIVDSYTHCSMIGGMTKTPTMSLKYQRKEDFTGGAAIIAKHLKAAGSDVSFSTLLGEDAHKDHVVADLIENDIKVFPIFDKLRPTTNKNAFVVGDYRVLKVDVTDNRPIEGEVLEKLCLQIKEIPTQAVVFSDFRHGIFNPTTIPTLSNAIPMGAYKVADSQVASRWGNILDFEGFDLITPNEKEARFSMGDQDSVIRHLGANLFKKSNVKSLFLKLGDRGLIVFKKSEVPHLSSFFLDVFTKAPVDPVGAGDALLAYSTLAMVTTKNEAIAAILGSIAASLECEKNGNVSVYPQEILERLDKIESRIHYKDKVLV